MRVIITLIFCSLLFSCTSTKPVRQSDAFGLSYIDLTADSVEDKENVYWKVTKRIDPRYPPEAARDGYSGCVEVVVGIDSTGKMAEYKIKSSYPKGVFDESAVASLSKWRWEATNLNPDKSPVLGTIQLDFLVVGSEIGREYREACGYGFQQ